MNPATDAYRTALAGEVATSATATTAIVELTGPFFQIRREVSRFDLAISAAVGMQTLLATVPASGEVPRRYETRAATVPAIAYRTTYANELAEGNGAATHALCLIDGPTGADRKVVARFDTLARVTAAFNTASAAATGYQRYKIVIL